MTATSYSVVVVGFIYTVLVFVSRFAEYVVPEGSSQSAADKQ